MGSASSTRGSTFLHVCKQMSKLAVEISKQNYPYRIRAVEYTFLTYSQKFRKLRSDLIMFMERYVFGNERKFLKQIGTGDQRWKVVPPIMEELKELAKAQGLWNLWLPAVSGLSQLEYA